MAGTEKLSVRSGRIRAGTRTIDSGDNEMTQQPWNPMQPQGAPAQQYQPTMGQPPQGYAPPAEYPSGPAGGGPDPFNSAGAPGGGGGGDYPHLHQLIGRLLLIQPQAIELNKPSNFKDGKAADQITADVVVCDGPPIDHKVDQNTMVPTFFEGGPKQAPFLIPGMWINGRGIVPQLKASVPGKQWVLGRLYYGEPRGGKPPYLLNQQYTPEEAALGRQVFAQVEGMRQALQQAAPQPFQSPPVQQAPYQPPAQQWPQPQQQPYQPPAQQAPPAQPWPQPQQAAPPAWGQQG
jgi:hypothetical protein